MANNWLESIPDLDHHDYEIYNKQSPVVNMTYFHVHPFYEIRFIIHGQIIHNSGLHTTPLSNGMITMIPPGMFHRINSVNDSEPEPYSRVLLYISDRFLNSLNTPVINLTETFDRFGASDYPHFVLSQAQMQAICAPLQLIVQTDADDQPLSQLYNRSIVAATLYYIAQQLSQIKETGSNGLPDTMLPARVIDYINRHLSEDLSLTTLANHFFVSKYYLAHQFKEYTQLPIHQYIQTRRLVYARHLLQIGYQPADAASAAGYHEYSTFYKAMIHETGHAPAFYVQTQRD